MPFFSLTQKEEPGLTSKSIAMQAQNIYVADSIRRFSPPVMTDTFPFFGKSEYTYSLDDYKRFTAGRSIERICNSTNVVLRNGKLHMSVYDEFGTVYTDEALVLLDGVPLMDCRKYSSMIRKLKTLIPGRHGKINFKE
jgi:hypothetical protein